MSSIDEILRNNSDIVDLFTRCDEGTLEIRPDGVYTAAGLKNPYFRNVLREDHRLREEHPIAHPLVGILYAMFNPGDALMMLRVCKKFYRDHPS